MSSPAREGKSLSGCLFFFGDEANVAARRRRREVDRGIHREEGFAERSGDVIRCRLPLSSAHTEDESIVEGVTMRECLSPLSLTHHESEWRERCHQAASRGVA